MEPSKAIQTENLLVTQETEKLILEKTPAKYIKQRRGPGGTPLSYVEVGYVIERLNKIFNYNWDFETTSENIGKKQIYVKGRLTGRLLKKDGEFFTITKEQYGGVDIKFNRQTGAPVSIGDDLKAAASDALKKCSSMFGIAQDVYWMSASVNEVDYDDSDFSI